MAKPLTIHEQMAIDYYEPDYNLLVSFDTNKYDSVWCRPTTLRGESNAKGVI